MEKQGRLKICIKNYQTGSATALWDFFCRSALSYKLLHILCNVMRKKNWVTSLKLKAERNHTETSKEIRTGGYVD